jgi:predicted cupin superfamily sugar epimerase
MHTADYWIAKLSLVKHPEGGHFREVYRSSESTPHEALPPRFSGSRAFSTSIYFLLQSHEVSRFHRIKSDEVWHFYAGSSLMLHVIDGEGAYSQIELGSDLERGESLQAVVPAGCWFGATVNQQNTFTLVGCTVAPGFDFADFEIAKRDELLAMFPQHSAIIKQLTG